MLHKAVVTADRSLTTARLQEENPRTADQQKKAAYNEELYARWRSKVIHGRYPAELENEDVDRQASLMWLTDGLLYPETEGFFSAIQDGVIKTRNYGKYVMKDGAITDDKCRLCGKVTETIEHIISACEKLVTEEYRERHDSVAKVVHGALVRKWGLQNEIKPYWEYEPAKVCENEDAEILWDRTIYTYKTVTHNRPDIVFKDKKAKLTYLIDIAVPNQNNMKKTVSHKVSKYKELSMELTKQWKTKTRTLPIVITTVGVFPKTTVQNLQELGCTTTEIRSMQKAVILHTTRIVRKVINEETTHCL